MKTLKFWDFKGRKAFTSSKYTIKVKNGRTFAETVSPSGGKAVVIVKKGFKG